MKVNAKKMSALLLALALLCALMAGCGGDTPASSAPAASAADTPAPGEAPAEQDKPDEQEPVAGTETGEDDPEAAPQESREPQESEKPAEKMDYSGEDVRVETPWCTMVYPGDWAGALRVDKLEGEPYCVVFSAQLQGREAVELFAISFGGERATVGYVKAADGSAVPVEVSIGGIAFDDGWSEEEKVTVHSMKEALNDILAQLPLVDVELPSQPGGPAVDPDSPIYAEPDEETDLRIDTPYVELRFPSKWSERLSLRTGEDGVYSVGFCCKLDNGGEQLLFTLYFGGDRGIPVTTITAYDGTQIEVRVEIVELAPAADWTDEDHGYAYAMQEDMNYLFSHLG